MVKTKIFLNNQQTNCNLRNAVVRRRGWTAYRAPTGLNRTSYCKKGFAMKCLVKATVNCFVGYSNLTLVKVHGPKSVEIGWKHVRVKSVRGHFKGYRIQSWTEREGIHRSNEGSDSGTCREPDGGQHTETLR